MHLTIQRQISHTQEDELWDVVPVAAGLRDIPPNFFDYFWGGGDKKLNWHDGRILPDFQILYLARGCGVYESNEAGSIEVRTGDLLLVFPNLWHRYHPRKDVGWRECWVTFRGDLSNGLLRHGIITPESPVLRVGVGLIDELCEEIANLVQQPELGRACLIGLNVALILTKALNAAGRLKDERASGQSQRERAIDNAVSLMENQTHMPINVAALAQSVGMSLRNFRRQFKEIRGMSPQDYHVHLRIGKAENMLCTSNASVSQIAEVMGYADVHQFCRMFRKVTGTTPSQYRSSCIQDTGYRNRQTV